MQKDTHQTDYVASSVEKKRVVVMYLFFGIFVSLNMKTLSEFESSHLRQAVGWRIVFIMALILGSILLFIPVISFLSALVMIVLVGIWGFMVYKAWSGSMAFARGSSVLYLFVGIGEWCLDLFDIDYGKNKDYQSDEENEDSKSNLELDNSSNKEIKKELME